MAQLATPVINALSSSSGLVVRWDYGAEPGLIGFRVIVRSGDYSFQQECDAFAQSYVVAGLDSGTYQVGVQAIGDGVIATDSSVVFIQYEYEESGPVEPDDVVSKTITNLRPGTSYDVQVSAVGDGEVYFDSDPTGLVFVTVDGEDPYYRKREMGRLLQNPGVFDYVNTTESIIKSGDPVVVGDLVGVAVRAIGVGELGAVSVEGIYELEKDSAAIDLGAEVYINTTSLKASATSAGGKKAGYCVKAASAADPYVQVLLR